MRVGGWLGSLVLFTGCFHEPGSASSCERGTPGCPCASGSCDPGLACEPTLELCIPANCMPGTELCTCYEGECFGALQCAADGLCRDPAGTGSATSAVAEVTGVSASATSGASLTSTMDEATTRASGETIASDETRGPGGAACHACTIEENVEGGNCVMPAEVCATNSDCMGLSDCVGACLDDEDFECIKACCLTFPNGAGQYAALSSCWSNACSSECATSDLSCA